MSAAVVLDDDARTTARIPIGRPIWPTTRVYVLDAWLAACACWCAGELYIAGAGLARGYLGRRGLTAERFVADPFGAAGEPDVPHRGPGALACRRGAGVPGARGRAGEAARVPIEPGEIEAALLRHGGVAQAAVIAREDVPGRQAAGGYVVAARGCELSMLRRCARISAQSLPDYMVPSAFVVLERLPLTPNGKLDRARCRRRSWRLPACARAPRTPQEEILCALFAEVLGLERVGIDDNFFALGGDSIMSIQLVSRARKAGLVITPRAVFQHQTVAALAAVAGAVAGDAAALPDIADRSVAGDADHALAGGARRADRSLQPGDAAAGAGRSAGGSSDRAPCRPCSIITMRCGCG